MSKASDDMLDKLIDTILFLDELETLSNKYYGINLNSLKSELKADIVHKARLIKIERENI